MLVLVVSSLQVWLITRLFISFVISFIYCFNVFCQTNAFLYFPPLYFSCTQDINGGEEDCQVDRDYWRGNRPDRKWRLWLLPPLLSSDTLLPPLPCHRLIPHRLIRQRPILPLLPLLPLLKTKGTERIISDASGIGLRRVHRQMIPTMTTTTILQWVAAAAAAAAAAAVLLHRHLLVGLVPRRKKGNW